MKCKNVPEKDKQKYGNPAKDSCFLHTTLQKLFGEYPLSHMPPRECCKRSLDEVTTTVLLLLWRIINPRQIVKRNTPNEQLRIGLED